MRKSKPFKPYLGARHHRSTHSKHGLHLDVGIGLEAKSNGRKREYSLMILQMVKKLERRSSRTSVGFLVSNRLSRRVEFAAEYVTVEGNEFAGGRPRRPSMVDRGHLPARVRSPLHEAALQTPHSGLQ